jgi:hypothetical protein
MAGAIFPGFELALHYCLSRNLVGRQSRRRLHLERQVEELEVVLLHSHRRVRLSKEDEAGDERVLQGEHRGLSPADALVVHSPV